MKRGDYVEKTSPDGSLSVVRWMDNAPVTVLSNTHGSTPVATARRYDRKVKKHVDVTQPQMIRMYNRGMGGCDLADEHAACYRPTVRNRKWWWALFGCILNIIIVQGWLSMRRFFSDEWGRGRKTSQIFYRRQLAMELLSCGSGPRALGRPSDISRNV